MTSASSYIQGDDDGAQSVRWYNMEDCEPAQRFRVLARLGTLPSLRQTQSFNMSYPGATQALPQR